MQSRNRSASQAACYECGATGHVANPPADRLSCNRLNIRGDHKPKLPGGGTRRCDFPLDPAARKKQVAGTLLGLALGLTPGPRIRGQEPNRAILGPEVSYPLVSGMALPAMA